MDRAGLVYLAVRGYWLTRYLAEAHPALLRQQLARRQPPEALALAREANDYTFATLSAGLDRKAPRFQIKEDPQAAATTAEGTRHVILRVVDNLKMILAHTAQQLHEYLGYEGQLFGTQDVV